MKSQSSFCSDNDRTLYKKPIDRSSYLNFRSFHPFNLRASILFSQFLRVKRNCTFKRDFIEASATLKGKFLDRGYPSSIVERALQKAATRPRSSLLEKKQKKDSQRICFSLQYTPLAYDIKNVIMKHWHIISHIPGCSEKPCVGMRRARTFKDMVVHTNIQIPHTRDTGSSVSGHYHCKNFAASKYCVEGKKITHPGTGQEFENHQLSTCTSKFCVYVIWCQCLLLYVGCSIRSVKVRVLGHVARIRNRVMEAPLTTHFIDKQHEPGSLRFFVLEMIGQTKGKDRTRLLHQRELFWIHCLNMMYPAGLNKRIDYSCFL